MGVCKETCHICLYGGQAIHFRYLVVSFGLQKFFQRICDRTLHGKGAAHYRANAAKLLEFRTRIK